MLNEERIILMTKMASYEENEGKKNVAIGNYFRSDYITLQVLKSIISSTIAFLILLGLYVFYNFESVMQDVYKMDLLATGKRLLLIYAIVVGSYTVISYIVYAIRYSKAKKNLKKYYSNLKKLAALYKNR